MRQSAKWFTFAVLQLLLERFQARARAASVCQPRDFHFAVYESFLTKIKYSVWQDEILSLWQILWHSLCAAKSYAVKVPMNLSLWYARLMSYTRGYKYGYIYKQTKWIVESKFQLTFLLNFGESMSVKKCIGIQNKNL